MSEAEYVSYVSMLANFAKSMLAVGLLTIIATRFGWNTRGGWAGCGLVLLLIAIGNAVLLSMGEQIFVPEGQGSLRVQLQSISLSGLVIFGSMGSRFIAEWLTSKTAK